MMKRNTRIFVSITGIIIVTLMLLGLTYGYFITQISGNTNEKSVEVATGTSKVLYTDLSENNTSETITPGYKTIKTFTIKNIGDTSAKYSIYLVDVVNTFNRTQDLTYSLYKIKGEVSEEVTVNTDFTGWENIANNTYPKSSAVIKANEVIENPNDLYTYVLLINYAYSNEDQNEDQGKTFAGSINIRGIDNDINPFGEGTFAYNIMDNALSITENESLTNGYAMYTDTLRTTPAEQKSASNESLLLSTEDDYGTSYYYRGNVQDNYVNFAGMCWKIVRIVGDGSIKLLLQDKYAECDDNETTLTPDVYTGNWSLGNKNYGYEKITLNNGNTTNINKYLEPVTNANNSMIKAYYDFQKTLAKKLDNNISDESTISEINSVLNSKLKAGDWCLNDAAYSTWDIDINTSTSLTESEKNRRYFSRISFFYDSYIRLFGYNTKMSISPTLRCTGTILNSYKNVTVNNTVITTESPMYIGAITADELVFSGGSFKEQNNSWYISKFSYDVINAYYFWSLTPVGFYMPSNLSEYEEFNIRVTSAGYIGDAFGSPDITWYAVRPMISLSSRIKILEGGDGTLTNPYVVE